MLSLPIVGDIATEFDYLERRSQENNEKEKSCITAYIMKHFPTLSEKFNFVYTMK